MFLIIKLTLSRHRPQKALQRYYFFTKQTNFFVPLFKISTLQRSFQVGACKTIRIRIGQSENAEQNQYTIVLPKPKKNPLMIYIYSYKQVNTSCKSRLYRFHPI